MLMAHESTVYITDAVSVPLSELDFRFSRSSGPGGQHANRSATRVELLFDVAGSPSLNEAQRQRVLKTLESYIDKEGTLHLVSQTHRSQFRNREEVVERFQTLMQDALRPPKRRVPTRPTKAVEERRLRDKQHRSEIKRMRRPVPPEDMD